MPCLSEVRLEDDGELEQQESWPISATEGLRAVDVAIQFAEQQEDANLEQLTQLHRLQWTALAATLREKASATQWKLDQYFSPVN